MEGYSAILQMPSNREMADATIRVSRKYLFDGCTSAASDDVGVILVDCNLAAITTFDHMIMA